MDDEKLDVEKPQGRNKSEYGQEGGCEKQPLILFYKRNE
jgi:hypothetical protein